MTARIDLPGSEDSIGSPLAPGRASRGSMPSVTGAWLRDSSGSSRVAVIGIGLGGLLAIQAAVPAPRSTIWSSGPCLPADARTFESCACTQSHHGEDSRELRSPIARTGQSELAGYLMSAETVAALSAVDLAELALPADRARHVLLIGRDEHGVDERYAGI